MKKKICLFLSFALVLSLAGCGQKAQPGAETPPASPESIAAYTAGTYTATTPGRNGDLTVSVTLSDNAIEKVEVVEHVETEGVSDLALSQIPDEIVTYQSLGVDSVAGATITSMSILRAVGKAIDAAGGDSTALAKVAVDKPTPETKDLSTGILVVGGGISGMIAAIAAADHGTDVTLVEKLGFLGGTFMVSAAYFTTAESENLTEQDDSLEKAMEFVRRVNADSVHQPDFDFLSTILSQTGATIDYMIDDLGLEPASFGGGNYAGTSFVNGETLAPKLIKLMEDKGVRIILNTAAQSLVTEDGKVTGAVVSNRAGEYTITAKKIIMAAGGASWDVEALRAKNPELSIVDMNEKSSVGNTGDGIRMLGDIGAQVDDVLLVKSSNIDFAMAMGYTWKNLPTVPNQLIVDAEGNRFANEAPPASTMLNTYFFRHPSKAYYGIFDTVNTNPTLLEDLKAHAGDDNARVVVYAETIEELAGKLGMEPAVLKATFDTYQGYCRDGKDPDFGKDASHLVAYAEEGGYYAAYLRPASWGTIGGVITDKEMRVLRSDGTVIDNVFAVGETATSRLFGDYYLGGFSLGLYSTMGRIAAETAAAEINQ